MSATLRAIAQENERFIADGHYVHPTEGRVDIGNAVRAAADGMVGLLDYASARNAGGGYLNGAKAQEEDLCRCSATSGINS
ncbi:MAG TPA: TIGR02452 family protein [Pseudonocardiaceae bacterium]